ncbi:glycoside-pentoside-hexuronide (GPH):cation symporter [Lacticaseibacillus sp. GG6-2]
MNNPGISKLKLSNGELLTYGLGDFASNLCWTFIGGYLTIFYTDILGVAPALASVLIMTARVFDGVWDPIFGMIAERTNTKFGRFRPYIIFGAPFLAIFSVLSFTIIGSGTLSVLLAFVSYFICGLLFTVVNLSYGSLATVMTTDQEDLAQLTSYRMIGTNLSSVLITASAPLLLSFFSIGGRIDRSGYFWTALIFSVLAIPLFILVGTKCKENVRPVSTGTHVKFKETIKVVLKNRPLLLLFLMMFAGMLAMFGRIGTLVYYVMYTVKQPALISAFMTIPSLAGIVGIYCTKRLVTKVGRKRMCLYGYLGCGLSLLAMFVIGEIGSYQNIVILLIMDFIYGLFNFVMPIPMAMVADAINYGEYQYGVRSDGTSYAVVSVSVKLGSAFGASLGLLIMAATGYIANQSQTAAAQTGINGVVNLFYGVLWLLCLIPLHFYPLTESVNNKINNDLAIRRERINLTNTNITSGIGDIHVLSADAQVATEMVDDIFAMADGQMMPLTEVNDPITAKGLMGTGFAILPENGKVVSPVSGQIINIFISKHAIGIRTKSGVEILIHMGIDTFNLKGKPFELAVEVGDEVSPGQLLAKVDLEQIREAKRGTEILFIVTNHLATRRIAFDPPSKVKAGNSVGRIVL